MDNMLLLLTTLTVLFTTAWSLQCYRCRDDHWNWGECTENIQQCEPFQDACVTYTQYTLDTYWTERGERFHRISKGCDSQQGCLQRKEALDGQTCERSMYHDWSCVECCTGDLCNFFATLTASPFRPSMLLLLTSLMLTMLHFIMLRLQ